MLRGLSSSLVNENIDPSSVGAAEQAAHPAAARAGGEGHAQSRRAWRCPESFTPSVTQSGAQRGSWTQRSASIRARAVARPPETMQSPPDTKRRHLLRDGRAGDPACCVRAAPDPARRSAARVTEPGPGAGGRRPAPPPWSRTATARSVISAPPPQCRSAAPDAAPQSARDTTA
jgi:hypothetical protein